MPEVIGGNMAQRREVVLCAITGLSAGELRGLHRVTAAVKRVQNMTKKGKMYVEFTFLPIYFPGWLGRHGNEIGK